MLAAQSSTSDERAPAIGMDALEVLGVGRIGVSGF